MYTVNLTYFKNSGKYYSEGSYESRFEQLWEIFMEVSNMLDMSKLPGLAPGHSYFIVLIDVPNHPHNHPHLVF